MRNLDKFREAVDSPNSWNLMGYFCPKITFLQLKHYIQRVYPTILSTFCVKFCQMIDVIFETISNFSRHSPTIFFSSNITYFLVSLSKWKFSELPQLALKFTKFLMSFLKTRVSFSSNFVSLFSVMRPSLLYFFI